MMPSYEEVKLLVQDTTKNNIGLIIKIGEYIQQLQDEITELKERVKALEEKPSP